MKMPRSLTVGIAITAAAGSVGLTVWKEAFASRGTATPPVAAVTPIDPNSPEYALHTAWATRQMAQLALPAGEARAFYEPQTQVVVAAAKPAVHEMPAADPAPQAARAPNTTLAIVPSGDFPITPEIPAAPSQALAAMELAAPAASLQTRVALIDTATHAEPQMPAIDQALNAFGIPCDIILSGSVKTAAMVSLTLSAPCRANATISVEHGPLVFTERTDDMGMFKLQVPALADPAAFTIRFDDDTTTELELEVPSLRAIDRVVLQWQGDSGLQIHAREFGADYGTSGHVWFGAARSPEFAAGGRGGFLTSLGQQLGIHPNLAEVYTFPSETMERDGVVRLSLEAEITPRNCGREIAGQVMQADENGKLAPVLLTLAMPDCDAVGEFLVLKNLLRDLKIAANSGG